MSVALMKLLIKQVKTANEATGSSGATINQGG